RLRPSPSHVPVHPLSAAKPRGSPPTALDFTAETDSPLEGTGFEPSVPRKAPGVPAVSALVRAVFRWRGIRQGRHEPALKSSSCHAEPIDAIWAGGEEWQLRRCI